jgi:Ca-activated chloride channel homolog
MTFLWPQYLWLMLPAALLPLAYAWLLRRRKRQALRYSSVATVRAADRGRSWRRHLPPALLLLAVSSLLLAAARPVATVPLPWARTTVILAMDVSLSMRVRDVHPNRLVAAQEAAKLFLRELPKHIEVGLVTFAGTAQVVQRATQDREALVTAIDAFQMQRATAVGNAIVVSLSEIFPDHGLDVGEMTFGNPRQARSLDDRARPAPKPVTPVAPGSYASAAIILLTDGRRTTGIDTLEAAKLAADRGVRIDVIGLGTVRGEGWTSDGMPMYLQLDEPTLREVARMTGGEYHHAGSAEQLQSVYQGLGSRVQLMRRETELGGPMSLFAALLAGAAGVLSMLWFGRFP